MATNLEELVSPQHATCPPGRPDRVASLQDHLAFALPPDFQLSGRTADVRETVLLAHDSLSILETYLRCRKFQLDVHSSGGPAFVSSLHGLACYLSERFPRVAGTTDRDDRIKFEDVTLALCPQGHPQRAESLRDCLSNYRRLAITRLTQPILSGTPTGTGSRLKRMIGDNMRSVSKMYQVLSSLPLAQFVNATFFLPCIVYRVESIALTRAGTITPIHVHQIQAVGLKPIEVALSRKLEDTSSKAGSYVLVRPWHPAVKTVDASGHHWLTQWLEQPFNALSLVKLPHDKYQKVASFSTITACGTDLAGVLKGKVCTLGVCGVDLWNV